MLENNFFKEVKTFVFNTFKKELPVEAVYHNYNHSVEVVKAASEIANALNISDEDKEVLFLACWFHDIGIINGAEKHEEVSKKIASKYLKEIKFSETKIAKVCSIIDATKMPQKPKSLLDEIICDADLFHIGTSDFKEKTSLLRVEWEQFCNKSFTDVEWLQQNLKFIEEHKYFTDYVYNKLNKQKISNWLKIKKDLKREEDLKKKKKQKKKEIKRKKEKDERPEKGIETMYKVTLRNHIKLSDIADTKANILLSVSAIILSIALSNLFPKLDKPDNAYLIAPTLLFLVITVITMIFSILSTRPKVTSGEFTKEDVANKKVNLLFFGNFHKMPIEEFQDGMNELMKDKEYLYKSLNMDLYYLGLVLQRKYKLLRIAYNIFMVGIVLSVISFIISFAYLNSAL
ncbi:Pycsar system effector family protein [Lutibacter citreus]|uniref:Pycsar system effector family protein n=1 Tax=Lutibacter citreus TaxID=2138210 RepID=UPI000DBE4ECA|nr:Pycsar system effector family protein [Lutibacter citreus]